MKVKSHFNVNNLPNEESAHPGLTPNHIYIVIGIDNSSYRIVNDHKEPILYDKDIFDVIDPEYPDSWVLAIFDDGEYYIDPPELSARYFYEDYFDGVAEAVSVYNSYLNKNGLLE